MLDLRSKMQRTCHESLILRSSDTSRTGTFLPLRVSKNYTGVWEWFVNGQERVP